MGLLKEALLIADKNKRLQQEGAFYRIECIKKDQTFAEWAKKNKFFHAAVFECVSRTYSITHSYSLDAETIKKANGSADFFNGSISGNNWIFAVSGTKSIQGFYQFFSEKINDSLRGITFLRLSPDESPPILMVVSLKKENLQIPDCNEEFKKSLISILENKEKENSEFYLSKIENLEETVLKENQTMSSANLFTISFKDAILNEFKDTKLNSETIEILKNTLFNQIFYSILTFIDGDFFTGGFSSKSSKINDFKIKTALFSKSENDIKSLDFKNSLISKLKTVISEKSCEKVEIIPVQKGAFPTEIYKFLTRN